MRTLLVLLAITSLTACGMVGFPGVYRINIEQGNIINQELVDQLKPGMSRRQVRFILGTPLVEDPFNTDRWDYLYSVRNGLNIIDEAKLTVFFDGDSLTHFTGTFDAGGPSEPTVPSGEALPPGGLETGLDGTLEDALEPGINDPGGATVDVPAGQNPQL
jgi:outer membrane protein assembly factor BamE